MSTPSRRHAGRALRGAGAVALAAVLSWLVGCSSEGPEGDEREEDLSVPLPAGFTAEGGWHVSVAAELGEKLGGCVVGNVDPDRIGNEIVVVGESGAIHMVSYDDGEWSTELLARAPGEMIQVAVGDVLELTAGLEIVVVGIAAGTEDDGGEGAAHLLVREGERWSLQEIYRSPALLHAVCVTDLHSAPGDEIVVAGFSQEAVMLVRDGTGWSPAILGSLGGAAKSAVPYQEGFAVGCTDGSIVTFRLEDDTWQRRVADQAPAGVARIATDDERLLAARDDGVLGLVAEGSRRDVHREADKLRGAVVGNLDPASRGLELATAGYSGAVTVLLMDDPWKSVEVFRDTDRLHHLASGTLGSVGAGAFLVACGYSGKVIVIGRGN